MTVYRIVNGAGVMVSAAGWPDDTAVYRNAAKVDREIRRMNDPDWPYPGSPQPQGGPFRRQVGEIHWRES